jgi:hypothetical protein
MTILKGEGSCRGISCVLTGVTMPDKYREKPWTGHIP